MIGRQWMRFSTAYEQVASGKRWMSHGCVQAVVRTDAGSEWTRAGVFRCLWAQGLLDYDEVRELGKEFGYPLHIRPRNEEAQALKRHVGFKARRWVVERTHSWMNRFRSVLIRWDKKVENYLGLLHLACAFITYRATGLLG
jgi:hypothetical protein